VKQLALTHLSPRYVAGNPVTAEDLLLEAQAIFPHTVLAKDFLMLNLPATVRVVPGSPPTAP
jgi:ribonuclease Z